VPAGLRLVHAAACYTHQDLQQVWASAAVGHGVVPRTVAKVHKQKVAAVGLRP
jgi:hypothetical protein